MTRRSASRPTGRACGRPEPLSAATPLFLENEFGRGDVNKFAALAESADPVASLDRATYGISANTVQERLTAAFDKLGVRSRRELVAAVLSGHR